MGYLTNFMVYTLAMIGVIAIALLVFKNSSAFGGCGCKSKYLKIIDSLTIAPRKTLYVVSTGRENFLIAGDADKTTLISKLENGHKIEPEMKITEEENHNFETNVETFAHKSFKDTMASLPKSKYMDKTNIGINSSLLNKRSDSPYTSVIRSLASKMQG